MRAVVAHSPDSDVLELRRILLGAGLDCASEDCIEWDELVVRLAQGNVDLLIVRIDDEEKVDWQAIHEASVLTSAPRLAIGPAGQAADSARRHGWGEYLDETHLHSELDGFLAQLHERGRLPKPPGTVVSVFAPTAGSGGTTVASNLAGSLALLKSRKVALVELSHEAGDLALLLNLVPQHTVRDVCQRWQRLDVTGLTNGFSAHETGLNVLTSGTDHDVNEWLTRDAVRRIAVLCRVAFEFSILLLDSRVGDEEVEAMRLSNTILMVVRPDVPAVRRTRRLLQVAVDAGIPRDRFQLVVNRCGQGGQLDLRQIESSMGMKAVQLIPDDPTRVNKGANEGKLLHELAAKAKISRRFAALAGTLNGTVSRKPS